VIRTEVEALPADVFGLSDVARAALAAGPAFAPLPLALRASDVARPDERLGADERASLVESIRAGHRRAGVDLAPEAGASLDALLRVGTSCVVTGQQPGFLASPLYSLYKALQACRLAEEVAAHHGAPCVPVFWNHADDHDVAEVHHAWILNRNLDLQRVNVPGLASGRTPVGEITLDAERQALGALRAQLRGAVEEFAGADAALELFMPRDGETLARAFTRVMGALCGRYGLVVVEPAWIRAQLSSELGRIVSGPRGEGGLAAALESGERALAAEGLAAAIPPRGDEPAALLYRHVEGAGGARERVAVRADGDGFRLDGARSPWTAAELGSLVVSTPEEWSAGALLRPIAQDAVFPTCAYVGGYGELAYHAQLGPARDAADVPRTAFVPRVGLTIADDDLRYALHRVGDVALPEVLAAKGDWRPDETDLEEPDVVRALRAAGERAREDLLEHRAAIKELEPALAITLKKTAGHVEASVGKVIDKAMRVHRNRRGKGARQVRRLNNTLQPRHAPQERVLGPFQFVARFGDAFVDALRAEIPAVCPEHLALHLFDDDGNADTES